ncbi:MULTISPECIES: carboxypeptidase-like regulatory domain-containing protein [Sorangium]|uniref:Carboxypeptidase-like regulatory domain-containing protein n=1 Tax=Sorangium atrum TaxID=2995308 RepID=A0ABT5CA45_9BACT|nr:carboxypeptidase-like regulatory domain-containing protein [Sorangium aterium]MDC0683306.1 carboxypeptidase-like regulatory domain-containing protein [Sorangium aterium]
MAGCSCGDTGGTAPIASGGAGPGGFGPGGGSGSGGGFGGFPAIASGSGVGGAGDCEGLECQQVECENGAKTTVSGTVYDPSGKLPLYNVIVYVPNAPLDPIPDGATCDQCSATLSGSPLVTALTDTEGKFVLEDVPVGENIPLVVQVGKWRREMTLPVVKRCEDTATDAGIIRLPRNQSEGHIPKIALTTGGADPLECLLHKLGIDESEFTPETGTGRINLFAGRGDVDHVVTTRYADGLNEGVEFTPATSLWGTVEALRQYDMVILACEGDPHQEDKPGPARQAMLDYTSLGGRVFASHWHNVWLKKGPAPFPDTAVWDNNIEDPESPLTARVDTTLPKGQALAEWLVNVGASDVPGEIVINGAQHTVSDVTEGISTRWIYYDEPEPPGVQYFTFNTPVDAAEDQQCGRLVFTDIHVSAADLTGPPFPGGCSTEELSAQEKALLFMLFDLSSCIVPDDEPPPIPIPQ